MSLMRVGQLRQRLFAIAIAIAITLAIPHRKEVVLVAASCCSGANAAFALGEFIIPCAIHLRSFVRPFAR